MILVSKITIVNGEEKEIPDNTLLKNRKELELYRDMIREDVGAVFDIEKSKFERWDKEVYLEFSEE